MNQIKFENIVSINGKEVNLPFPVVDKIEIDNVIVIRVEPIIGSIFNRNVYCFSQNGEAVWQIEESPHGDMRDKPFVSLSLSLEQKLIASNWNGIDYSVSLLDGSIKALILKK